MFVSDQSPPRLLTSGQVHTLGGVSTYVRDVPPPIVFTERLQHAQHRARNYREYLRVHRLATDP